MSEDGQALVTETDAAPAPSGEAAAGDKRRVSFGASGRGGGVDLSELLQPRKGKKASRGAGSSSVIEGSLLGVDGSETPQPMSLL